MQCTNKNGCFAHCRESALREVPVQVVSERTAEAQAAGQSDMERAHVAVSVTASVEQVYQTTKVTLQLCVAVHYLVCEQIAHMRLILVLFRILGWLTTCQTRQIDLIWATSLQFAVLPQSQTHVSRKHCCSWTAMKSAMFSADM